MINSIEKQILLGEDSVCEFKSMRITGKRETEPDARNIADEFAADDRDKLHRLVVRGINHRNESGKGIEDGLNDGIKAVSDGIKSVGDGIKGKVLAAIRNNSGIRVPGLVLLFAKSKPTIERAVAQLKKEGIIEYRGSKKTGGYFLK